LDLPRVEERGQRLGDVVKRALAPLVFALDPLPARPDGAGRVDLLASEDVWVSPDELVVDRADDGLEVAPALLLQAECEEDDLVEEVAEFVDELRAVVG